MALISRPEGLIGILGNDGAPSRTRTCGLLIRSQTLYPTELWVRQVNVVLGLFAFTDIKVQTSRHKDQADYLAGGAWPP